jgi:uncharacterized membrane protein YczE
MSKTAKQKFARRVLWEFLISLLINVAIGAFIAYHTDLEDFWTMMIALFIGTFVGLVLCDYLICYIPARIDEKNRDDNGNWVISFEWSNPKFLLKFILWNIFFIIIGWTVIVIIGDSFVSKLPAIIYFGLFIGLIVNFINDNRKKN